MTVFQIKGADVDLESAVYLGYVWHNVTDFTVNESEVLLSTDAGIIICETKKLDRKLVSIIPNGILDTLIKLKAVRVKISYVKGKVDSLELVIIGDDDNE